MQTAHDAIQGNVQFRQYSNFPPRPVVVTPHTLPPAMIARPAPVLDLEVPPKLETAVEPVMSSEQKAIAFILAGGIAIIAGWGEFPVLFRVFLCILSMLLFSVPYFKKNPFMWI